MGEHCLVNKLSKVCLIIEINILYIYTLILRKTRPFQYSNKYVHIDPVIDGSNIILLQKKHINFALN